MKKIIFISLLFSSFLFVSCEQTDLVEVDLVPSEQIVVESEIETGQPFSAVKITRTLPIDEEYDIKKAEINNAYAYLLINGVKFVPLHYTADGLYSPLFEVRVEAGDIYELFAKINNNSIYSRTKAPKKPDVLSVNYNNNGYFEASVNAVGGEAYGAVWIILTSPNVKDKSFFSIETTKNFAPVRTRTNKIDPVYLSSSYTGRRRIQVFAFDEQFADYFKTKPQIDPGESGVTTGGSGVAWNVKGNNVIGLFIGVAKVTVSNPL